MMWNNMASKGPEAGGFHDWVTCLKFTSLIPNVISSLGSAFRQDEKVSLERLV